MQARWSSANHSMDSRWFQGVNVELCPSHYEESLNPDDYERFSDFVEETALHKVLEVSKRLDETEQKHQPRPDIIIGADTMVTIDGKMYGKPKSKQDAIETLRKYS